MSVNTSNQCLTPTVIARNTKRQRANLSPDSEDSLGTDMDHELVGTMTTSQLMNQLMGGISSMLDDKLSSLATKKDFENLSKEVHLLKEENKILRDEISSLKTRENKVMSKLIDLESRSRRNNLVFKGLRWSNDTRDFRQIVSSFCVEVLGCSGNIWVNRAHPLGKSSTIIAHLPSDSEVELIMSRVSRLKNTGYVVHRDFPKEVRESRAHLTAVRAEIERVAGRRRMPLVFDHLTVEGSRLTWQDGKLRAGLEDGAVRLKKIFNHDFVEFLTRLQDEGPREINAASNKGERKRQPPAHDLEGKPPTIVPSRPVSTGSAASQSTEK